VKRRNFLFYAINSLFLFINPKIVMSHVTEKASKPPEYITLFLCGDVMTGRGIDQVLPHPSDPRLYEPYVRNAKDYVALAEAANGPISQPVDFPYIWGDALTELEQASPDVRIINLETSITKSNDYWKLKAIHYRMHPKNIPCITAAGINCCVLANNHVLDWGYKGLTETLQTLQSVNLKMAGAGRNAEVAEAPAVMNVEGKGRVVVFSFGMTSSGVTTDWAARIDRPGVNLLPDVSSKSVDRIREAVQAVKRDRDIAVASIHWGGNWGYEIPHAHIQFAHKLLDSANIDIIHGHSSHHPIGIEIYNDKPIIYGCGDFLNDYEGISGYEEFRDDLTLMYFVRMAPLTGKLVSLEMVPMQIQRFRLQRASDLDIQWLHNTLDRESKRFNHRVELTDDNTLLVSW
jgi:poly-gamma-glutamate capsule biosynthesis protein CapA/YwtB (metallophosphatase superfamily)